MSDSDSEAEFVDWEDVRHRMNYIYDKDCAVVTVHPTGKGHRRLCEYEAIYECWNSIPLSLKKEAGQLMRICAFWYPILLQRQESNNTTRWAVQVGFIDSNDSEDLTLRQLYKIEILEAVLRALEKGCFNRDQTMHVIWISNKFNLRSSEVLDDALRWLERTEEPAICKRILEFGHGQTCYSALQHIFTEYAQYIRAMGINTEGTMTALAARPSQWAIEKSEEMKSKGNANFQKKKYDAAVKFYSQAIRYYPENHIIYGNRALCYIRCEKYLKAVGDGKRATLIKPLWAKGHYRYCEALFYLGEVRKAIEANCLAQTLCKEDREGAKDLELQHSKFLSEMAKLKAGQPKKSHSKRPDSANRADTVEPRSKTVKPATKVDPTTSTAPQSKVSQDRMDKQTQPGKNGGTANAAGNTKDSKQTKSEANKKMGKGESNTTAKKKSKNKTYQSKDEKASDNKAGACAALRSAVQDAHAALADLRSRNAEQAFSQALALLEASTPKELGLSTLDILLLLYGRASALTEVGQPEELGEAQRVLEKMNSFEERTFQCLVYYGIGRVYLKENRYPVALAQFSDSLQMVKNQITPGKLTWPMTKEIVKETQLDYFKDLLMNAIELCKFPPIPDAICRLENCLGPLKVEIYLTDPDFKGFIRIGCCQSCNVEYHITCWKALKAASFFEKNEKEFLQDACFTPDCGGQICSIKIFGSTGLLKCKFEAAITKPKGPEKLRVNQKCTSMKKLKSKEDRKLRRKQHKPPSEVKQDASDDILLENENSATQSQQKAWLLYRDRVLLQISQNMELLREENGLPVAVLISSLKPWLELDSSRGNQLAERMLSWQQQLPERLGQAVELLLERRNRVWARVLIQELSSCLDVNAKLHDWARQLNNAGLNAAKSFIERYAGHLEELDLAVLLNFGPLQDMIIEKLGTRPEFFTSIGLTVTEYLKQAPEQDMRLFIWTLEEHRDQYASCHTILDEYFEMMDGHCLVLKKSENENHNNSPIKTKNRGRKKKQKEPKGVIVLSGMRGATPRDDWDQDIFDEEDSLSFLHPGDPFSVPGHLREQVADFEDQYNGTSHRSHYKNILDNNPDPTRESLYDYFAQILEEHGPLAAEDALLVGELDNFPPVAQQKIQEAGGFEPFLLESLRFIKMGSCIGLAKHAVSLQQAGHGNSLDELDVIADPDVNSLAPDLHESHDLAFASYLQDYSSAQPEVYPFLPNPYVLGSQVPQLGLSARGIAVGTWRGDDPLSHWTTESEGLANQPYAPYFSASDSGQVDLYASEMDEGVWETITSSGASASMKTEESLLKKPAPVQACRPANRSVAVNTEVYEPFESSNGDINKKEKSCKELEEQITKIMNDCDGVNLRRKEAVASLEKDFEEISANIQVTNKELALFQQKLEEEVKKDQKEKKSNQEVLKSLKMEIEQLVEDQESHTKNIREKNNKYHAQFNEFLELSNQSAAEKMSLEDEIKRCKDLCTKATRRSHKAQLSVVESGREQGLHSLYKVLMDSRATLAKLEEVAPRYPPQDLAIAKKNWRVCVQEAEKKISIAEAQYQDQINQMKSGSRMSELLPVNIANPPELPAVTMSLQAQEFAHQPSAQSYGGPALIQQSGSSNAGLPADGLGGPAPRQPHPRTRTPEPQHNTVFHRALERLATMFPDYTRPDLMRVVQELRSSSGGSLSSMTLQDVVSGVTQLILDQQEQINSGVKSSIQQAGSPAHSASPSPVPSIPVWQAMGPQRPPQINALNEEDPCIICHDDMSPDDVCVLECRHSFHKECIRSWLREQSTCPTCRDHALLPDDFPMLPGRRRRGYNQAF
ncbi:E3 ubiquitin-protein ligase TTC3 isoform X1 [Centroberyx affinis]|uniref:E3 ubiquitin-protein ligase TTC3 isoform X1 n=1 Tax=Centroberyx affinis TaxID=166261 RepID=UPI003A5C2058